MLLYTETGEIIVAAGAQISDKVSAIQQSDIKKVEIIEDVRDTIVFNRGKASDVTIPESGPVRFRVTAGRDVFTVLASPSWYWKDMKGNMVNGMDVQVRGWKTLGKDGNLYLIAQEVRILNSNKVLVFRGETAPRPGAAVGCPAREEAVSALP